MLRCLLDVSVRDLSRALGGDVWHNPILVYVLHVKGKDLCFLFFSRIYHVPLVMKNREIFMQNMHHSTAQCLFLFYADYTQMYFHFRPTDPQIHKHSHPSSWDPLSKPLASLCGTLCVPSCAQTFNVSTKIERCLQLIRMTCNRLKK